MSALSDALSGYGVPKFPVPHFELPNIPHNPLVEAAHENKASEFHKRLVEYVAQFDATLDQDREVGMRLVCFGQELTLHVEAIGYYNPSLVCFYGQTDKGRRVQLVQHVSQINFLLVGLERLDLTRPKKPFGFGHPNKGEPEASEGEGGDA